MAAPKSTHYRECILSLNYFVTKASFWFFPTLLSLRQIYYFPKPNLFTLMATQLSIGYMYKLNASIFFRASPTFVCCESGSYQINLGSHGFSVDLIMGAYEKSLCISSVLPVKPPFNRFSVAGFIHMFAYEEVREIK